MFMPGPRKPRRRRPVLFDTVLVGLRSNVWLLSVSVCRAWFMEDRKRESLGQSLEILQLEFRALRCEGVGCRECKCLIRQSRPPSPV
ncbi:hypothetical protein V8F06_001366 [Rhypophila decipiens]